MTRRQFITGRWSKGTMAVRPSAFPRFATLSSDQLIAEDIADRLLGRTPIWMEPGMTIDYHPSDTQRDYYFGIARYPECR